MTDPNTSGFRRSKTGMVCAAFIAIAAFFLITEHTAHVLGALPYLLLAACPLMHLFHHHGGGGGHGHGEPADAKGGGDSPRPTGEPR